MSDFQTFVNSCFIDSRKDQSPKNEVVHETKFSLKISYPTHVCLNKHQISKPVLRVQFPLKVTLFLLKLLKTLWCQLCAEMSETCYLRKPRVHVVIFRIKLPYIHWSMCEVCTCCKRSSISIWTPNLAGKYIHLGALVCAWLYLMPDFLNLTSEQTRTWFYHLPVNL